MQKTAWPRWPCHNSSPLTTHDSRLTTHDSPLTTHSFLRAGYRPITLLLASHHQSGVASMSSLHAWRSVVALVVLVGAAADRTLAQDFFFKPKDRIVFLGDSITEQYDYTNFLEYYLVTRFPT